MSSETETGEKYFETWELDSYTLQIRLIDGMMEVPPVEVWTIDELDPPGPSDRFDFQTIGQIADSLLPIAGLPPAPFTVRQSRSYVSWGASAAGQEIIFEIACWALGVGAAGVVGNAMYDALKSTVIAIVAAARRREDWQREPMSREEAAQRARWHLIQRFDLKTHEETHDRPTLVLVGEEERNDGSRLVRFRDGDKRYEVEFLDEYGLVRIGRIGWSE
jgi:hypothetical protein